MVTPLQDPVAALSVLQLRRLLRALGLETAGLRAELEQRVRRARASGLLLRFAEGQKRAAPAAAAPSGSGSVQCGELVPSMLFCVLFILVR